MQTALKSARHALYAVAIAVAGLTGPNAMAAGYPNPQLLTSAAELAVMLNRRDVRVIDVRSRAAYDSGHIPGALHLGADDVIDPKAPVDGVLRPTAELAGMIGRRGIDKDVHVVLYDDKGGFHAARLFWMFEYFGHQKVSILNGGIQKWLAENRKLSRTRAKVQPAAFAPTLMARRTASADWLLDRRNDADVVVIDVRPASLFDEGHIPWATNIPWAKNLAADKTTKSADELRAHFAAFGVKPEKNVAVHCQNGKAAAHSYFTLRLLGFPRVRAYDRSWAEWGAADDLPKASGAKG